MQILHAIQAIYRWSAARPQALLYGLLLGFLSQMGFGDLVLSVVATVCVFGGLNAIFDAIFSPKK
jgi:hypothetical protein